MRIICENYLKILIFLVFFLNFIPCTNAETGYISPESYAVNEADLNDYMDIAPSPKLKIDDLDKPLKTKLKSKPHRVKSANYDYSTPKPVKKGVIYHMAKWWVDQRYKREEAHHGEKHEIKVKARMEYEKQQAEQQKETNDNEDI